MFRQILIFSLVLSSVFMATSADKVCFTRCMSCLMIDDSYCPMDVTYPTGAEYCLRFCNTDESSLPRGSVYGIINSLRHCRQKGKDVHACVRKLT